MNKVYNFVCSTLLIVALLIPRFADAKVQNYCDTVSIDNIDLYRIYLVNLLGGAFFGASLIFIAILLLLCLSIIVNKNVKKTKIADWFNKHLSSNSLFTALSFQWMIACLSGAIWYLLAGHFRRIVTFTSIVSKSATSAYFLSLLVETAILLGVLTLFGMWVLKFYKKYTLNPCEKHQTAKTRVLIQLLLIFVMLVTIFLSFVNEKNKVYNFWKDRCPTIFQNR